MADKKIALDKLVVMWDFQNVGVSKTDIDVSSKHIQSYLVSRFPTAKQRLFKAFSHSGQSEATDILMNLGWRVWEDDSDMDQDIVRQARSDCGAEPESTVLVLITRDGDFVEMIDKLKAKGAAVYVMAPPNASEHLLAAVGKKKRIPWKGPPPTQSGGSAFPRPPASGPGPVWSYDDDDD